MTRALGWLPPTAQAPGRRTFAAAHVGAHRGPLDGVAAGSSSDNTGLLPERAFDQLHFQSCVGNAVASSIIAAHARFGRPDIMPSRMTIWQRALRSLGRWFDGAGFANEGIQICTAIDLCAEMGTPLERDWAYDAEHFAARPGPEVDMGSYSWRGRQNYHPIASWGDDLIADLERACAAGYVVPFGLAVTERFCSERPIGTVHAPKVGEVIAGGHAMVLVGHDRENERFLVRNLWGDDAGDPALPPGYLWLGYDYLRTAADLWLIDAKGGAL